MSMFPIPEKMMPDVEQIEAMNREFAAFMTLGGASSPGAVNLMMHPAGGLAAATALSMGVASQAFGVWMGAVAGSMEAARELCGMKIPGMEVFGFGASWDDSNCDVDAAKPEPKSPVSRAKSAARTLMADFESASVELAGATGKMADAVGKPAAAKPAAPKPSAKENASMAASSQAVDEVRASSASPIMPEDFRQPAAIERPGTPDDLKLISGIGPKLEQVLNGLGVWTFAQIAGWTPEEVAWVDDYLGFGGRIGRDEWLKQARALAGKAD